MERPRILLLSAEPVFNFGGVGKTVQWIIGGLSDRYQFSLAAPDGDSTAPLAAPVRARFAVPARGWDGRRSREFLRRLRADGINLVHVHGGAFSFDAHIPWRGPLHRLALSNIPWMLTNHCAPSLTEGLFPPGYPAPARGLKTALAWASECALLARCRRVTFASDENRSQIDRWFPWAKGRMETIYNSGLDGAPPAPAVADPAVTIGNLGHIAWRKGQDALLKAFILVHRKYPHLKLILAGPGHDECAEWIRDETGRQSLQEAVRLPGGIDDKTEFWRAVDIYVQPSLHEGAPMALMEALWQGKPAVGTRVSGIPEMIEHEKNGLLVEPGDPEALAAAIERLVNDAALRRRFSAAAARLQAKGMTRPAMLARYAAVYDSILGIRR